MWDKLKKFFKNTPSLTKKIIKKSKKKPTKRPKENTQAKLQDVICVKCKKVKKMFVGTYMSDKNRLCKVCKPRVQKIGRSP